MSTATTKRPQLSPQQKAAATKALVGMVGAKDADDMRTNHTAKKSRKPGNPKHKRSTRSKKWGTGIKPTDTSPVPVNADRAEPINGPEPATQAAMPRTRIDDEIQFGQDARRLRSCYSELIHMLLGSYASIVKSKTLSEAMQSTGKSEAGVLRLIGANGQIEQYLRELPAKIAEREAGEADGASRAAARLAERQAAAAERLMQQEDKFHQLIEALLTEFGSTRLDRLHGYFGAVITASSLAEVATEYETDPDHILWQIAPGGTIHNYLSGKTVNRAPRPQVIRPVDGAKEENDRKARLGGVRRYLETILQNKKLARIKRPDLIRTFEMGLPDNATLAQIEQMNSSIMEAQKLMRQLPKQRNSKESKGNQPEVTGEVKSKPMSKAEKKAARAGR